MSDTTNCVVSSIHDIHRILPGGGLGTIDSREENELLYEPIALSSLVNVN